jgi:endoribonuclease Nob1
MFVSSFFYPGEYPGEALRSKKSGVEGFFMNYVLDASVFFSDFPVQPGSFTTSSVAGELVDLKSKCRFDLLSGDTMQVRDPRARSILKVKEISGRSGDLPVLSATDIDILALALELEGAIITDDYAVQNVAKRLGIEVIPIHQRPAQQRTWKYRCLGCGRYFKETGECPVCGSPVKRKLK